MATRIRTLNFLPEIFKTASNSQFLAATLDQLVAQPNTQKIQGYIGSKFGYGVNAKDYYVTEPTKTRTDYQLDPGVVFLKENDTTAKDFISYPGIIDALKLQGGITGNNNRLFNSEFYSWDSFTNLDTIINFNQYYWLPAGPSSVTVSSSIEYNTADYIVESTNLFYLFSSDNNPTPIENPSLTLLRGGTYTFTVDQTTQFWIQGVPGVTGYNVENIQTRNVYGVTNNGITQGVVTFTVPQKNALDEYNFPGNNRVDVISTLPFSQVNEALVNDIGGIDGVTALEGLTVMFYNTGVPNEIDPDGNQVNATFYIISLLGSLDNPEIQLTPAPSSVIPTNERITANYGNEWINNAFYRSGAGVISLIPFNSAIVDILYYQDGTNPNKVGIINLAEDTASNVLDVDSILGKVNYTSPTGVVFTNGLKVIFQGNVIPTAYINTEYYVEGVGTAIELIAVTSLVSPETFTAGEFTPFDTVPYDIGNYDSSLYLPITPDYITIARNSISRNPWSRGNRWFHIDVITATAEYNNNPELLTLYTAPDNKARRPIIEFYPNLRLFNSGIVGKNLIDFIDTRTTDAFTYVAGQTSYYPDVAGWTGYDAVIAPVTANITTITATQTLALINQVVLSTTDDLHINDTITFTGSVFGNIQANKPYYINNIQGNNIEISELFQGTPLVLTTASGTMTTVITLFSTYITIPTTSVFGLFENGQYITDSTGVLPTITSVTDVNVVGPDTVLTVSWYSPTTVLGTSVASLVTADTPLDNYSLFDGARIVFAADTNLSVRNKIYISRFSTIVNDTTPIITLTEADDGLVLPNEQTAVYRGYNNTGNGFYFDGEYWIESQQKTQLQQAPKFDLFDYNGVSLGDGTVYLSTSFTGCTLFSYGIGTGSNDIILGFPLRYNSVDNLGDISFDITLNNQTFNYVEGTTSINEKVNIGYVYNNTSVDTVVKQLGWQTAVSPSVQYQIFNFDFNVSENINTFTCDITPVSSTSTNWPTVQVYINNNYLPTSLYTFTTTSDTTTIELLELPLVNTVIQVLIISDQISSTAYYQTPINLNNNPFNQDITSVNIGDIRGQYQSIFYNNPYTIGEVFGSNNYHNLGNLVPWGSRIIQNSASLVLPSTFLHNQSHDLFNALLYNSRQYINFKNLLVNTIDNTDFTTRLYPAVMLDTALDQINASYTDSQSFFWSDMLPSKAPYISNTYSFANSLDTSRYPLSRIYTFATANYYGVLVYLTRSGVQTQLISGVDYTISSDSPVLTITTDLIPNDQITVKEYNQTYGSYVPNTPTKLGLYPATIPNVTLDTAYSTPTYFIVGHDGSFNKLYGEYNSTTNTLSDFRDQVLLEYETRVYNNLKLSETVPAGSYEGLVIPGFFRNTDYNYDEFLQIYSESFLNWVGQNRIDYKTQLFNKTNQYSLNYRNSGNKLDRAAIEQGYFRGTYLYFYDTSTPDETPWEMIGFTNKPTWWEIRYGAAPYTSENLVLWGDLAAGVVWNNGEPFVRPKYIRDGLLNIIPVNSNGDLIAPFESIVGNYNQNLFQRDWKVGDVGPTEFSYRRSSTWPFDWMRILALTKPADFFNLGVDVDNYKYNLEFNQYLVNNRTHLSITDIPIYGLGTPATSYINWIVDYEKQVGVDATTNITTLLNNLDVRLVYRMAGFSDKNLLQFYVEKSSANSNNSSLLIPDESYNLLLYENQPFDRIVYSSVIIQISKPNITSNAFSYKVYGNSQTNAYFKIATPIAGGRFQETTVEKLTVVTTTQFSDDVTIIPYGTEFYNPEQVSQFLVSYGEYLTSQGVIFEQIENGIPITWQQMVAEFLYWVQTGWGLGSITTINPSANILSIDKESQIVQPLTIQKSNFVLNQNLYPISLTDMEIVREGTLFSAKPLNQGDTVAYSQLNISNVENGIVFDNITLFNDIIYNLVTGLRQNRITVRGTKTAEWDGKIDAFGFILNQDNIQEWSTEIKYTQGSIVKYKNRYWSALRVIQAATIFNERDWVVTSYDEIQKGLLPNSQTRSYESTLYYDVNTANLENDADLLSFSLIGYRPRSYMALADFTDITQVNIYQNLIKDKGTLNAASAFKGASLPQGGIDYELYENWAIQSGEFGGVLNNNFIEFRLSQPDLTGNPSIVGLTNGIITNTGVQQEVPLSNVFNYGRPITSPNVLQTLSYTQPSTLYPTAGYVNFNDVKMASYYYSGLSIAQNAAGTIIPISEFYVRDYVWLANYMADWQVYSPASLGSVINAKNNLNGTVTITFRYPHNLTRYQIFAIANFDVNIDNYYVVALVVDSFNVIINMALNPQLTNIAGLGIGFRMQSYRVVTAPEIINLPLLDNEFNKLKVWVDTNTDGDWAVYRKSINYQYTKQIENVGSNYFGSAVACTTNLGFLIGDSISGEVYRYRYNAETNTYSILQAITKGASFGSTISYIDDLFVISEPTGDKNVYIYQLIITQLQNSLDLYQTIAAPIGVTNWGTSTALSGDKNWLYISDTDNAKVYVYRRSPATTLYVQVKNLDDTAVTLSVAGVIAADSFGYSISTDYYGDTIVIGTPQQDYDINTANYGYTYVFGRTIQNFEAQSTSQAYIPLQFQLAWTPAALTTTANSISSNAITLGNVSGLIGGAEGTPIVFTGTPYGGIAANTVYYVKLISGSTITLSLTRNGTTLALTNSSGTMTANGQTSPLFVSNNGTAMEDSYYSVIGSTLNIYSGASPTLNAGDILNVSSINFVLTQTLTNNETARIGVQFGTSVETNKFANEILVGAPFELSAENYEGAVHRYTNGGEKYGTIIGTEDCNITTPRTVLLNGFKAVLPAGDAATVAASINFLAITNIYASDLNGKLIISLIDTNLSVAGNKLSLTVLNSNTLSEMGVTLYTPTQKIYCPHLAGRTQFGSMIKLNNSSGSIVISAPAGTRFSGTTFDFTDDELDNDTVFDNNATQWVDTFTNAGAVYMFDYVAAYNEDLNTPGKFVYAQNINAQDLDYGSQPYYGTALDFNDNTVVVGSPNFNLGTDYIGQVVVYNSAISGPDWAVFRSSSEIVDINGVFNIQLFSASTNNTVQNLDYIDPLQGKLLGAVAENIDVVSNSDPASYNSVSYTQGGLIWGTDKIGQLWFNTSNSRFMNYHQNDITYNSQYWGRLFPGSNVAVYSWIVSNVPPSLYQGPGTPYSIDNYTTSGVINAEGLITPVYYFWARNTNIIFEKLGKTLADSTLEFYITQPASSGISFFAPLLSNVFGLYNCFEYINAKDTVLHIGYATGSNDDVAHSQYSLIRANYADDFLSGFPGSGAAYQNHASVGITEPIGLYNRMLDSMCGVDNAGGVVPDPLLPKAVQTGVLARPRQGFFYDRFGALKNYLQYANIVLSQFPITELRNATFLSETGEFFNTTDYWNYINWWAPGYSNNTKSALQVPIYADLSTLSVASGTIVTVALNGNGNSETYILSNEGVWVRIGLTNGTIEFKSTLWDYAEGGLGFGDSFFDTTPYDSYPSTETRYIIRALNEQIYTNELLIFRNKSLILLFEYIQSETIESQNYLTWLNKTSFLDVSHTIRELVPLQVFRTDNQLFLEGYLDEVKPYHVVIKEFIFKYTRTDIFEGDITDFDLPAQFQSDIQQFITPALVYSSADGDNEYLYTDPIWQTNAYSQWFNNYGLNISGQNNYPIALLESYMSLNSTTLYVSNINGFPVTGVITIGEEKISYVGRNLATNQLTGISRGVDSTTITIHLPGEKIYTDLPAVLVLYAGKAYTNPPKITVYIDLSLYPPPRVEAQFVPIMSLGSVIGVNVINPGEGYAVLPEINIEPSFTISVDSSNVNSMFNTIQINTLALQTGDLIVYTIPAGSSGIQGLIPNQKYYINLLEIAPVPIFALYNTYQAALADHGRIELVDSGSGIQNFSVGAIASCVPSSTPTRENSISIKFDRTTYNSQIIPWASGNFYGASYAGDLNTSNQISISSSSLLLSSTQPPINSVSASVTGSSFEIIDAENQQTLTWSSRTRTTVQTYGSGYSTTAYQNAIRIIPSEGGAPIAGSIGSTIGFYIGMPVKFIGSVTGTTLVDETIYYVKSLVQLPTATSTSSSALSIGYNYVITVVGTTDWNSVADTTSITYLVGDVIISKSTAGGTGTATLLEDTGFTLSASIDVNGNPGTVFAQNTATISLAGLTLYVGELTNVAVMTLNYSGIRSVTNTAVTTNFVTVQLSPTGLNGTTGFYVGLPVFLVGDVFGGVIENEIYYVITVIDNKTFTMSTNSDPTLFYISATSSANNSITCESTLDLRVNEPIIFTGGVFGGIVAGQLYYIRELFGGNTTFSISLSINGSAVSLSNYSIPLVDSTCVLTSQADALQLTTGTGLMTLNVGLPVSPGQINGQALTFYVSGGPYVSVSGTVSNLLTREITSTLTSVNRICLSAASGGITNIYDDMDFDVASNIGGLTTAGGPYTIIDNGVTLVTVTNTNATGNWLTLPLASNPNTTDILYVGMPIVFTGTSLGGISLNTVYYVYSIDGSPPVNTGRFKIASAIDSISAVTVTTSTGTMTGTGETYITVSNSLSTALGPVTLTQVVGTTPTFNVSYTLGGYIAVPEILGSGYAVNNIITILGTDVGGTTTTNDLSYQVLTINSTGGVLTGIGTGTPAGDNQQYYVKVYSENQIELYSNPELTAAVTGQNFPFIGITSTTVTGVTASTNRITVASSNDFNINDAVEFTAIINATSIEIGQTYQILTLGTSNFTLAGAVTNTVGQVFVATQTSSGTGTVISTVFGGLTAGYTYYVKSKPTVTTVTISETIDGSVFNILADATGTMNMAKSGDYALLPEPFFFNPSIVKFNKQLYQCVISNNDLEFVFGKWEVLSSGDYRLNALDRIIGYYQPTVNMPGVDLTQLVSGITYPNSTYMGNAFAPADEFALDTILIDQPFYPVGIDLKAIVWNGLTYLTGSDTSTYTAINASTTGDDWGINKISAYPIGISNMLYADGKYLITTNNQATPILLSIDGFNWSAKTVPTTSLNSVTYHSGMFVAVGENIVTSTDGITWTERFAFTTGLTNVLNDVTYVVSAGYTGYIAVGFSQQIISSITTNFGIIYKSSDGITWTQVPFYDTSFGFNSVAYNEQEIVAVGDNGIIYTSISDINIWFVQSSGVADDLNHIIWDSISELFVVVGENGAVLTSDIFAITWEIQTSSVTDDLLSVVVNTSAGEYVAVGLNNTIISSSDAETWSLTNTFDLLPSVYDVQGDAFTNGYGPEELVAGIVSDTISMIVRTRPGTNWDETIYQNVGYNVVSTEIFPTSGAQTEYSFANLVQTPAQLSVFVITYSTELSNTIYDSIDFTIDWINQVVILNDPLSYFVSEGISDSLRIDVYEVGNGYQLVKTDTENSPIRTNSTTGFNEIYVDANYRGDISQGSGLIRPATPPDTVIATSTNSSVDSITCDNVTEFVLNGPIYFQGTVFGGVVVDITYYVKTISLVTNQITISLTAPNGIAGPTFQLSTASGSMQVEIQYEYGATWTLPLTIYNGTNLVLGTTKTITRTKASNNAITCFTTTGLAINDQIVFSDTMFGGIIIPHRIYYVKTIIDGAEFTISTSPGGSVVVLTDSIGGASFVSKDYAIGIISNSTFAKLVFAGKYDPEDPTILTSYDAAVDYLNFTLFGETLPIQYGYTIPQTQLFTGNGSTVSFVLTNYIGDNNPLNAIVEIDGIRQTSSAYTISTDTNTIEFDVAPSNGSVIAVTSYNLTDRQYLSSQYDITGVTVSNIVAINIVVDAGGDPVVRVTAGIDTNLTQNAIVRIDDILGSTQLNNNTYYVNIITTRIIDLYTAPYDSTPGAQNYPVPFCSTYISGGFVWLNQLFTVADTIATATSSTGNRITVDSTTNLTPGTPVYFTLDDSPTGTDILGGIEEKTEYFVLDVQSGTLSFTISENRYPNESEFVLSNDSGAVNVSLFQQVNVDRLWVTVNGYRVPSKNLRLNPYNKLSILTTIVSGDEVIITSMMPTATPNEQVYLLNVSLQGNSTVFRSNVETRTWLTEPLQNTDQIIYLNDLSRVTDNIVQNVICPGQVNGTYDIGLTANKNAISLVIVYNNTTSTLVNPANYNVVIIDTAPILQISAQVSVGNELTITSVEGRLIYINGEQIGFGECDLAANTLSQLTRGVNGTGVQVYNPTFTEVFGIMPTNKMSSVLYDTVWNPIPGIYNYTEGDPLQIANTAGAEFLRTDIN